MTRGLRDQTRLGYDAIAAAYAEWLPDTSYEAPIDLAMIGMLLDLIGDSPARVLDAGCGTGRMVPHLHGRNPSLAITGVDLSTGMLEQARAAHPGATYLEGELRNLPVADGATDALLAWYSIIHTRHDDLTAVFAEFHRVLRPDGALLVAFQTGSGERLVRPEGYDVEMRAFLHETGAVEAMLRTLGFGIVARLDRSARPNEAHGQGFVLARRSAAER